MDTYSLYQSGIHHADIDFSSGPKFSKRDLFTNLFSEYVELSPEENNRCISLFKFDLLQLSERKSSFAAFFEDWKSRETMAGVTAWGDKYEKSDDNENLWVQREKKFPLDIIFENGEIIAFIIPTRECCNILVKKGQEHKTPLSLWENPLIPTDSYAVDFLGSFMVPMRDGVKLATNVWVPKGREKSPVVLIRTPYGKHRYSDSHYKFVKRGYALVIQDVRGREDSEGKWIPMHHEAEDGDDSLNWIGSQDFCDGNVGIIGASYGGYVQWAAASSGNKYLKALVSIVTAGGPFSDMPRKGGTLASGIMAWSFAMTEQKFRPENMIRVDWDEVLKIRPIADIPKHALKIDVPFITDWFERECYDSFWEKGDWFKHRDKINVPALIYSGWFDDNGSGTTEALDVAKNYPPGKKKVILGPYMHDANTTRDIHGVPFGANALKYNLDYCFQLWFDKFLKGVNNGVENEPEVIYYTIGDNKWRQCNQWPPENSVKTKLFLSHGKRLNDTPENAEGFDEYVYDPLDPAPHLLDVSENELGVPGNYSEMEKRADVLVYTTEVLDSDVTVVGDITASFYASSSAKDTDWVVRLTDVDPDGNSIKLLDGVLCAKFRNSFEKAELLTPGKIEKYTIRTSKTGNTFQKGHCIRLTITSGALNFIFPNSNTGNNPATDTEICKATQRIYYGGDYDSHIVLNILK